MEIEKLFGDEFDYVSCCLLLDDVVSSFFCFARDEQKDKCGGVISVQMQGNLGFNCAIN